MKRILRYVAGGFIALLVALIVVGLVWREEIERLYRVNTLFAEDRIVANFSNMSSMFLWAPVPRGDGPVRPLPEANAALPLRFDARGATHEVEDWLLRRQVTSLLVLKDGVLTQERYFLGTGPEDLRISWSMAKSVMATMIGIAMAEGEIADLDAPVTEYAPSLKGSAYEGATIRNVLNMASGVAFNEDYLDYDSDINRMGRELALGGSLDEFAGGLSAQAGAPGENWRYVSIDTHVLGMVLRGATGRTVPEYLSEKIWSRMGAEADAYYVTDGEGAAFVLGGLNARSRDYARFGQLILDGGAWDGARIAPADWVAEMTAQSAPPPADAGNRYGYGYQWWLPPEADDEVFAIGVYGQFIWIDRASRTVVVLTSADRQFRADDRAARDEAMAFFRKVSRP